MVTRAFCKTPHKNIIFRNTCLRENMFAEGIKSINLGFVVPMSYNIIYRTNLGDDYYAPSTVLQYR